jgi:hypothetical protein
MKDNEEMKSETGVLRKSKRSRLEKYKKEIEDYLSIGRECSKFCVSLI